MMPRNLDGVTIVVIDDDPDTLDLFATALEICGATVTTAPTARGGLELVRTLHPMVVISDIAMADHDGYWFVGQVRRVRDDLVRDVPVIAATAYGREHSRERTLAAGFDDYVAKPADPTALCRMVARLAGR